MRQILILCFVFLWEMSFAQSPAFSKLLNYYDTEKNFNGVVLVATDGKPDYINGAGISSRQSGTFINSKSKFKIASVTKTFTAVMVLQLMEEGKLRLQSTIGKYLPEYTGEAKDKVTIEHLLTYSSGIPNCESYIKDDVYAIAISVDSFIIKYCSGKLLSEPGTVYSYGNGEYIILGKIIEKITGKTFQKNLQERILKPLGMDNTDLLYSKDIITGLVPTYTFDDSLKTFESDKPFYIENFYSAGAMYSTVEDILKFDQGIFNHQLLKKESVDLMLTPHKKLENVGLGFWAADAYGAFQSKFVYRPGGIYGASVNWIHVMDANRAIIIFSNTNATNLFEMSQQLNAVATKQNAHMP